MYHLPVKLLTLFFGVKMLLHRRAKLPQMRIELSVILRDLLLQFPPQSLDQCRTVTAAGKSCHNVTLLDQ